jgi:hypothetical protein
MAPNFAPDRLYKYAQDYVQGRHTTLLMLCVVGLWQTACAATSLTATQVTNKPIPAIGKQPTSQAPTLEHF